MLVVHVHVHVKSESIDAFKQATLANAEASLGEPGVARFDVIQARNDPAHFVLVEVYKHAGAPAEHKQTEHYQVWRDAVQEMMTEPRASTQYESLFPAEARWNTPA